MGIIQSIEAFINSKKGNYLIFFPSYAYMEKIYELFKERNSHCNTIIQEANMTETEREDFLHSFSYQDDLVAFAVMGGIFSEAIDLVGEQLIGAVIVGVGLPQICFERDIIRDYFKEVRNQGFQYAYMYPGMNKILQAAGRVIRSEWDKGAILLIDVAL